MTKADLFNLQERLCLTLHVMVLPDPHDGQSWLDWHTKVKAGDYGPITVATLKQNLRVFRDMIAARTGNPDDVDP